MSEVQNTTLKDPKVGKNIPTVAKWTQGEVVKFAGGAAEKMRADGMNVLIEGREQTLNHLRSEYRFELTLSDPTLIGARRAALLRMSTTADDASATATSTSSSSSTKPTVAAERFVVQNQFVRLRPYPNR